MILSESIAKTIVKEVNAIIPMKINIMNAHGIIIASSDKSRVNSFHEGAYKIVNNQISEVRVNFDGEFDGALKGLNYPLTLQNYVVGVIGITGNYEEIKDTSSIIKKMTELILENTYSVEQKQIRENICNRYLYDWFNEPSQNIDEDFVEKGMELGFDIRIPRRILVCSFYSKQKKEMLKSMQEMEEAEKLLKRLINGLHKENIYYESGSIVVCALVNEDKDEIDNIIKGLKNAVEQKYDVKLAVGVDSRMADFTHAKQALKTATKANRSCMRTHKCDVRYYDDLSMEVFCEELSENVKLEFINKIFGCYCEHELYEAVSFLEVYYDLEGSINKTSEKLFIHKNTVQNRLLKILEDTGYDPRSVKYSSLFVIAVHFYRDVKMSLDH